MKNIIRAGLGLALVSVLPHELPAAEGEAQFLSRVRQLTLEGRRSGEGYYSPDGKNIIFQSEREKGNPFYQIYIMSLETGDVNRVSPGTGKTTCAFFRPGTQEVLFASSHVDPEAVKKQRPSWTSVLQAKRGVIRGITMSAWIFVWPVETAKA